MPLGLLSKVSVRLNARPASASAQAAPPRSMLAFGLARDAAACLNRARQRFIGNSFTSSGPIPSHVRRPATVDALESRQLLSATYFVATNGSNSNPGTQAAPFQTIQHAASIAGPGDTIDIRGGTYRETVTPARSGASGAPITYQAYDGEHVVIDGADPVTGWSNSSGSVYQANDPADLGFGNNQIFVNGQAVSMASWPNTGLSLSHPKLAIVQGGGSSLTDNALLTSGVDWTGGVIHIVSGQQWVSQTATITSDSGNRITFSLDGTVDPHGGIQPGDKYYLTGKLAAIQSGQFYVGGGSVYLCTPDGTDPSSDNVEAKSRLYGFNLSGKSYIDVQGINLFACSVLANGANNIHINAITDEYVSQFVLLSNGWKTPYNTGIVLNGSNNWITNSVIAYSAGDGIVALGSDNVIQNNIVHDCDYSATDCAGIRTWGSGDTISYNTVYNCARDGIKFSNTTGTQVTHNLVHDVMLQTTDGGGIYTYGTNGSGSQIAYNTVYNVHSGGWGAAGIYLDNGSSNFLVRNNDVFNVDIAMKMNPTSYNEKVIYNTLLGGMQSVGSSGSQDMSGSQFIGNVFNATVMIKGSVTISGNVSSGNAAGSIASGATISDTGAAATPINSGKSTTASKTTVVTHRSAAAAGNVVPVVAAPSSASEVGPFLAAFGQSVSPAAQTPTSVPASLATDRQSYFDAVAAVKAWGRGVESADYHAISADRFRIRHDKKGSAAGAADAAQLAADQSKLRSDIAAAATRLAQDKAAFSTQANADLLLP